MFLGPLPVLEFLFDVLYCQKISHGYSCSVGETAVCLRHLSPRNQNGSVRERILKCRVVRNREGLFVADRQVVHRRKQEQVAIRRNLLRFCVTSQRDPTN